VGPDLTACDAFRYVGADHISKKGCAHRRRTVKSRSEEVVETPRRSVQFEAGGTETEDDDDDDDDTRDEDVRQYGRKLFVTLASLYLTPYL
jgi:hypothetical protein